MDWFCDVLGVVKICNGICVFMFNDDFGIFGNEVFYFLDENIIEWNIYVGLGVEEYILNDEVRQRMICILNNIRVVGWCYYIECLLLWLKGV